MTVARLFWFFDDDGHFDLTPLVVEPPMYGAGRCVLLYRHFYDESDEETQDLATPVLAASRRFIRNPSRSPVRNLSNPPVRMGNLDN